MDLSQFERYEHRYELKPPSTLAVAAAHTLLAAFLHIQRVVAALRAEVAGNGVERERAGRESMPVGLTTTDQLPGGVAPPTDPCASPLSLPPLLPSPAATAETSAAVQIEVERARHRVRQRPDPVGSEADGGAAADAALSWRAISAARWSWVSGLSICRSSEISGPAPRPAPRRPTRLAHVDKDLEEPVLVAIERDVDRALRRPHLPGIALT